jgi:hypothetical protein
MDNATPSNPADPSGSSGSSAAATPTEAYEQPAPGTPPPSGPRVTRDEVKDLGRLRRSVTDRHVAGVAGGIARHLDVDPIIVRVALVVASIFRRKTSVRSRVSSATREPTARAWLARTVPSADTATRPVAPEADSSVSA